MNSPLVYHHHSTNTFRKRSSGEWGGIDSVVSSENVMVYIERLVATIIELEARGKLNDNDRRIFAQGKVSDAAREYMLEVASCDEHLGEDGMCQCARVHLRKIALEQASSDEELAAVWDEGWGFGREDIDENPYHTKKKG